MALGTIIIRLPSHKSSRVLRSPAVYETTNPYTYKFQIQQTHLSFPAYSTSMALRSRIKLPYRSKKSIPFCVCVARFSYWSWNWVGEKKKARRKRLVILWLNFMRSCREMFSWLEEDWLRGVAKALLSDFKVWLYQLIHCYCVFCKKITSMITRLAQFSDICALQNTA